MIYKSSDNNFYKIKNKIFLALTILILSLASLSCNSTEQENKEKSTYIITKPTPTGNIYTTICFKKIDSVEARHLKTSTKIPLTASNYKYNSSTSELIITLPKGTNFLPKDLVFTITGIPYYPGEFVLHDFYNKAMPGIFVNGKKSILNTDYTFDKSTGRLKFITPLDTDKDSFNIIWISKFAMNSVNNKYDEFENIYNSFEKEWRSNYNINLF